MEKAFYELLNNQITYNDETIPIIMGYPKIDNTPCITINQADETFKKKRYVEIDTIQYLRKRYSSDLWINIWCNNNKERNSLIKQINHRIFQAEANHYSTCANYNNGKCEVIESECEALTCETPRTLKGQCPNLKIYNSFFNFNHIKKNTFHINSITNLDELNITEPVLRSIFKLKMDYIVYYKIGGITFDKIHLDEDLL